MQILLSCGLLYFSGTALLFKSKSMLCNNNNLIMIVLICIISPWSSMSSASVVAGFGDSGFKECAEPNYYVSDSKVTSGRKACHWSGDAPLFAAQVLWGTGQRFNPISSSDVVIKSGLDNAYFPYSGVWKMRVYFCSSQSAGICSKNRAAQMFESTKSVQGLSMKSLADQSLNFGGFSGTLATSSNACYTFIDDQNNEWSVAKLDYMCRDVHYLPSNPATCYINYGEALDVAMGSLERSTIATMPEFGFVENVKKEISILCTRDSGITLSTSFNFNPIIVNGYEVVSTSSANLGVAIFYSGKLMGPSSPSITETYASGYSQVKLEFQAVRDPNVELKDVPTGGFTASAVMVMSEQ